MMKVGLILNPCAGRGKAGNSKAEILSEINFPDWELQVHETNARGHAQEIAANLKNAVDLILVAGGDGTANEVVNGMVGGSAALAVIPVGSGNDFVKMLKMPKSLKESVAVVRKNMRKKIDVGKVNNRYFPNGLGIGFDAWVVRESMKVTKLRGFAIYLYAVIKTVFSYKNEDVRLVIDGEDSNRTIFLVAIGNGIAMGGGFYLTPQANFDDGEFDICIIHALKIREVFRHLPKVLNGSHTVMQQVEMRKARKISLYSEKGIAAHVDGELLGMDLREINVSLLPKELEVIYNAEAE